MVMLVDIGNTRIKWCWQDALLDDLSVEAITHTGWQDALACLQQILLARTPAEVCLVHVLGDDFNKALIALCHKYQIKLQQVSATTSSLYVKNGYEQIEQLGADRFVALHGAVHEYPSQACIVVDCGTAITIDLVDSKGQHQGGVILPGLQLCLQSLIQNAEGLSQSADYSKQVLARNTAQGISWGCINGLSGAIETIAEEMENQSLESCQRIICGGDSQIVREYCRQDITLRPHLVLQGLSCFTGNI